MIRRHFQDWLKNSLRISGMRIFTTVDLPFLNACVMCYVAFAMSTSALIARLLLPCSFLSYVRGGSSVPIFLVHFCSAGIQVTACSDPLVFELADSLETMFLSKKEKKVGVCWISFSDRLEYIKMLKFRCTCLKCDVYIKAAIDCQLSNDNLIKWMLYLSFIASVNSLT